MYHIAVLKFKHSEYQNTSDLRVLENELNFEIVHFSFIFSSVAIIQKLPKFT